MARTLLMASLASMMCATSAHASQIDHALAFEVAPMSASTLASMHGTGDGFSTNFATMVSDRSKLDDRAYANVNMVAMDAWWAEVGAQLIVASIR